jgi:hypothetical protein
MVSLPVLAPVESLPARPRDRSECRSGPRPCPWVGCRYALYVDVLPSGRLKVNFPELAPEGARGDVRARRGGPRTGARRDGRAASRFDHRASEPDRLPGKNRSCEGMTCCGATTIASTSTRQSTSLRRRRKPQPVRSPNRHNDPRSEQKRKPKNNPVPLRAMPRRRADQRAGHRGAPGRAYPPRSERSAPRSARRQGQCPRPRPPVGVDSRLGDRGDRSAPARRVAALGHRARAPAHAT